MLAAGRAVTQQHQHLPPGRTPGRQSRQSAVGGVLFAALFGFFGVGFLLIFIPVAILAGEPLMALAGVGGAVAFLSVSVAAYRRARPRIAKHFTLAIDAAEIRRGDAVTARVELVAPDKVSERVEVGLECEVRYDQRERRRDPDGGYEWRRTTNIERAYEQWVPLGTSQSVHSVRLEIPRDEPYSHEGSALSFSWKVTAREPTALRADPVRHEPIWVLP